MMWTNKGVLSNPTWNLLSWRQKHFDLLANAWMVVASWALALAAFLQPLRAHRADNQFGCPGPPSVVHLCDSLCFPPAFPPALLLCSTRGACSAFVVGLVGVVTHRCVASRQSCGARGQSLELLACRGRAVAATRPPTTGGNDGDNGGVSGGGDGGGGGGGAETTGTPAAATVTRAATRARGGGGSAGRTGSGWRHRRG